MEEELELEQEPDPLKEVEFEIKQSIGWPVY